MPHPTMPHDVVVEDAEAVRDFRDADPVRVLVVSASTLTPEELTREFFGDHPCAVVVAAAGSVDQAAEALALGAVDVAILDHAVGSPAVGAVLSLLREENPPVPSLVMSTFVEARFVAMYVARGAGGFIATGAKKKEFRAHVKAAVVRRRGWNAGVSGAGLRQPRPAATAATALLPLSQREIEVLALAAAGMGNALIAETLFVSKDTVKTHLSRAYRKLGVADRAAATAAAVAAGLVRI